MVPVAAALPLRFTPGSLRALAELTSPELELEYLELVSPDTLAPLERLDGEALAVIAARVGATRLIDNEVIIGRH